ncbi:DUF221-domain-containing protein [Dendrothele bispora CBS 962.96]|uniref:DUF221-domain-containing protein n=1 Tax=Dendrothele bispora (strain CBS 962.96) TaxID=1314807 RepID=A0A4S8ME14_DENBC|nr:DUF221-domain-containing protein [Dendrothele bispora CBS 962.96]
MGDIQTRPFSKNYSGLINQSVIAVGITVLCVSGQELMRRARRGKNRHQEGLGSRESWGFGYLYQGRSWARYPSPPSPLGWPLGWVSQALKFPEDKLNQLRGVDAALYIRFLRGCFWFALLHTFTTFPVLFPIHLEFSESSVSPKSMTRASISSLVGTDRGLSLLWIHICLLFWITLSWMATLFWITHGAFRMRATNIASLSERMASDDPKCHEYHPHPHPQYNFIEVPSSDIKPVQGLRCRTVMVSNIPPQLRSEKELQEYFEYYMSRKLEKPALGVNSTTQPGFINKSFAFLFNHAKRLPVHLTAVNTEHKDSNPSANLTAPNPDDKPVIERVVIARKMTELASLLERREEILRQLETAHIKLAKKTLSAVKEAMERKDAQKPVSRRNSRAGLIYKQRKMPDVEAGESHDENMTEEERMEQLIKVLGPFVEEFGLKTQSRPKKSMGIPGKHTFKMLRTEGSRDSSDSETGNSFSTSSYPPATPTTNPKRRKKTVWDALLSVPRSSLDAYQPLVSLSHLFRGKTVPAIDYYTAKLNLLSSLITENRAQPANKYDPVSTAFVTFAKPEDARRACKYLTVHPHNPLLCSVTMAPQYQDLDWIRVMKSSFNAEFVKDWVVGIGVWAFTVFWLFPVTLLVGLVSIQNISAFWPSLKNYLSRHPWEEEVIQSFLPTLLVALLALLIPLILLLIAKKAHTITTLSALHDRIMTRYYKFLIVNVLVFFCVGTAALQSILNSFASTTSDDVLNIIASSFPTAGPFYVGWLIFTTAMHGGFEIALLGLPLIMYPTTRRQVTPRKRTTGIRPRTFNYYYWLPTHLLVIHVLLLFSVLNPFVIPFGAFYFFIEAGVVKNQLIHVYAKNYEGNGQLILIRVIRYSLDGLILSQAVFLAYMVVLKKSVNVGLAAFLIVFTVLVKIFFTRLCRNQFEHDDVLEARILCRQTSSEEATQTRDAPETVTLNLLEPEPPENQLRAKYSIRLPHWVAASYDTIRHHNPEQTHRPPIPAFRGRDIPTFSRIESLPVTSEGVPGAAKVHPDPLSPISPTSATAPAGPVSLHPPPITWDDQTPQDLPYDNPYYTRTISDILWLPRDPCGTLDLDDTIDLKISIAVDPAAGQIGTWNEAPIFPSQVSVDGSPESPRLFPSSIAESRSSITGLEQEPRPMISMTLSTEPEDVFDGTEEIDLPDILQKRAQEKDGVEPVQRPRQLSSFRQRSSDRLTVRRGSPQQRRPSGASSRPTHMSSFRSFSDVSRRSRAQSMSIASMLENPLQSTGEGIGLRPDIHAQADFVLSHPSLPDASVSTDERVSSRISVDPERPTLKRATNISAHQAIYHEVLAEEKQALVDRLEEEQAEVDKNTRSGRSWLTSWMFKKAE